MTLMNSLSASQPLSIKITNFIDTLTFVLFLCSFDDVNKLSCTFCVLMNDGANVNGK